MIGSKSSQCSASPDPLYIATVAHLSPTAYRLPRGTGCERTLITGYSPSPVVRSVKTASIKGAVDITCDGFTHPNRKRSLTRSQYKKFTANAKAVIGQNDGRTIVQLADTSSPAARAAGQNGKCIANLS